MIEPPKATKGRRMSKKSRKKSSKSAARRPAGAKPAARAKTKTAKSPRPAAGKSRKSAATAASHKAASKRLKISSGSRSKSRVAKTEAPPTAKVPAKTPAKAPAKTPAKAPAKVGSPAGNLPVLVEGAAAPAFRLPRDGGDTVSLADFAGRKLVLFFYPRADTPGCTREAIDFTRLSHAFEASGTAVLGISGDSLKAQERFRDKHALSVPLISDEQHEMLEAYGAWGKKSLYGRTFLGIIRSTVLIGSDGRVAKIWRNVKVDGHADAVLAAAQAL